MNPKSLTVALVTSLFLTLPTFAFATDTPIPNDAVSQRDREKVKKSVEALGQAFGVETPQSQKTASQVQPAPAPVVTEKTVADVLDKAIDKVSDVVGAMAKAIQGVAPDIWRIMLKQQYAKAVSDLVVPIILSLVVYMLLVRKVKAWKLKVYNTAKELKTVEITVRNGGSKRVKIVDATGEPLSSHEDGDMTDYGVVNVIYIVTFIVLGVSLLWLGNRLADTAKYIINPEFYAIQDLLRMILTRSTQ